VCFLLVCSGALACGSTEPARFTGIVRTDGPAHTLEESVEDGIPAFLLPVQVSFTNTGSRPVYVHQMCDSPPASDPTRFEGWLRVERALGDSIGVAFTPVACQDASSSAGVRALSPGESVTWDYKFLAAFAHPLTPRDSAELTGSMRVELIVSTVPGPFGGGSAAKARLLPLADRLSPAFSVGFP
jgi:hypothetical protein